MVLWILWKLKNVFVIRNCDFTILKLVHKRPNSFIKKNDSLSIAETNIDSVLNVIPIIQGSSWEISFIFIICFWRTYSVK